MSPTHVVLIPGDGVGPEVKVLEADVWGGPPVPLSEEEAAIVEGLDGGRAVAELDEAIVKRLAHAGVIDLV